MKYAKSFAILGIVAFGLVACAALTQSIWVSTTPPDAECVLSRDGEVVGVVRSTPGGMNLSKSKKDIYMVCRKAGYADAKIRVPSQKRKATIENVVSTAGIGWIIDSELGTNNEYKDRIKVTLRRNPVLPAPTRWQTVTDRIIAYDKPEGSGEANFMPSSVVLTLLQERAGWGLFEYKTLDGNRHRVWIAMKSVRKSQ